MNKLNTPYKDRGPTANQSEEAIKFNTQTFKVIQISHV